MTFRPLATPLTRLSPNPFFQRFIKAEKNFFIHVFNKNSSDGTLVVLFYLVFFPME